MSITLIATITTLVLVLVVLLVVLFTPERKTQPETNETADLLRHEVLPKLEAIDAWRASYDDSPWNEGSGVLSWLNEYEEERRSLQQVIESHVALQNVQFDGMMEQLATLRALLAQHDEWERAQKYLDPDAAPPSAPPLA